MLEALALRGEVAIAGRKGRQRYFDLPERVYPPDLPTLTARQAIAHRNERRLAALGIARSTGTVCRARAPTAGDAGEPAEVEGVPGTWRVHPAYLDVATTSGGAPRCSARSTGSSTTASAPSSSGASSTSSRCTSPSTNAAGATSRCRSCTTTGSSGSSTPRPTARPARSSSTPSTRTSASPRPSATAVHREIADLAAWLGLDPQRPRRPLTHHLTSGEPPCAGSSPTPSPRSTAPSTTPTGCFPPDVDPDQPQPPTFDDELIERETALIGQQDAVLLGRHMYDEWSRYWPTSDEQPFADFINGVKKYVVTSTPLTTEWGDAEAVSGSARRHRPRPESLARQRHRRPRQHRARPVAASPRDSSTSCTSPSRPSSTPRAGASSSAPPTCSGSPSSARPRRRAAPSGSSTAPGTPTPASR